MTSRRQKLRKQVATVAAELKAQKAAEEYMAAELMLGTFSVPAFDGPTVVFGASLNQYPPRETIPEVPHKYHDIVSSIFFSGGKFEDHGLRLKPSIHKARAMSAIRAWLSSFAPKHEHKTETVAWALSEWFEQMS